MIVYFRLLSAEADDFVREIAIDNNASFADLHLFIQQLLNYDATQMASFFTTDGDWQKETEVTLFDMGLNEADNLLVMQDTQLASLIMEEGQRLLYVFDLFSERAFFMEVFHLTEGELAQAKCFKNEGEAPEQIKELDLNFEDEAASYADDEEFGYDESDFDFDELSDDHFNENDFSDDY